MVPEVAGRLAVDNALMGSFANQNGQRPAQHLFVCDSMIGQDSVKTAKSFDQLDSQGFILNNQTATLEAEQLLSIKSVTGKPIKFSVWEKG